MGNNTQIYEKVYEFHGHVCLMSTAGIRIALGAMRAIGLKKGDEFLFAFYHARTCAVDPIQFITGCTLGNSNIIVDDTNKSHTLKLVRQSDGTGVTVTLKESILKRMKSCMQKKKAAAIEPDEETKRRLISESDDEFQTVLNALRYDDEDSLIETAPVTINIKPFLRF